MARALQDTVLIPGCCPLQEIIAWFPISQCVDVNEDEPLDRVSDHRIAVDIEERLLLIAAEARRALVGRLARQHLLVAQRADRLVGW